MFIFSVVNHWMRLQLIIMFLSGMDAVACFFFRQPLENCGRRSNRRAVSFEVQMMQGFEDGVVSAVTCIFPLHYYH